MKKVLILGAGQVGGTLAEYFAKEDIDVTIVDTDRCRLSELKERIDIQTVQGLASHPDVLEKAGAAETDIVIAVTQSDEVNIIASQICHTVFSVQTKIARIRTKSYLTTPDFVRSNLIPIDDIINPAEAVKDQIKELMMYPGSRQILNFAYDKVRLVAVKAYYGGPLIAKELRYLQEHIPNIDARIAAIFRQGVAIKPRGDTIIETDDEIFFVASQEDITSIMGELRKLENPYKRIIIAGGGNIGLSLAESVEADYSVKIIECSHERCLAITEVLNNTVVLEGDITDKDLLQDENIEETDLFCALSNDDEANIMSSLLAKKLGAAHVFTLINKPDYLDLVEGERIDIAFSTQQVTISALLKYVRRLDVARAHSLRFGSAEAMEVIVHGDETTSKVIGKRIDDVDIVENVTIAAVVRGDSVLIAHGNVIIQDNDHLILFLTDKRYISVVEEMFCTKK